MNVLTANAVERASIKRQCYQRYFYGQNDELEDAFASMERDVAPIIRRIICGEVISRNSFEHQQLLWFISFQIMRTRAMAEIMARHTSLFGTYLVREYSRRSGQGTDNPHAIVDYGVALPVSGAGHYRAAIADLDIRVLRVSCNARLTTSDSPVVRYNSWCEGVDFTGVMGAAQCGAQVFFPIGPKCALMLYDEGTYDVRSNAVGEIDLVDNNDVYQFNRLQTVFCQENIYFSNWEHRHKILAALPRSIPLRRQHSVNQDVDRIEGSNEDLDTVLGWEQMPNVILKLRFSRVRRKMRKIPIEKRYTFYRDVPPQPMSAMSDDGKHTRRYIDKASETWREEWGNIVK